MLDTDFRLLGGGIGGMEAPGQLFGATFARELEDSLEPGRRRGRHQSGQDGDRDPGGVGLIDESEVVLSMEEQLGDRHCRAGNLLGEKSVDVLVRPLRTRMPIGKCGDRHPYLLAGRRDRAPTGGTSRRKSRVLGSLGLHPVNELHELGGAPEVAEKMVALDRTARSVTAKGEETRNSGVEELPHQAVGLQVR